MSKNAVCVKTALKEFGLSDVEFEVYKAGLQIGSRPASIIAEKAGLKRTQTYNVLSLLKQKGIAQEGVKNSVRHYQFNPPSHLKTILENREEEFARKKEYIESAIPELEKLRGVRSAKSKVQYYRGLDGVKEIFRDIFSVPDSEVLGVLDLRYSWTISNAPAKKWTKKHILERESKNVTWRGICVDSPLAREIYENRFSTLRKTKWVKEELNFPAEYHIYGDKVAFQSTKGEMVGVVIENQQIAKTCKQVLELLWDVLPGVPFEG